MPQQTFANGEQLASVRAKLNGNAADVEARFGEVNDTLDLKADLVGGLVPAEQLPELSPVDLGAVFVQTDLASVLPATNPGSGRPWVDTSGLMRVGAGAGGTIPYIPSPTPADGSVAMFDGLDGLKSIGNATFPGSVIARETLELKHEQTWFTRIQAEPNLAETRFINTYEGSTLYGGWSFRNGTSPEIEQAKVSGDGEYRGKALKVTGGQITVAGSTLAVGNGMVVGYVDAAHGYLQTPVSVPLVLNPLGNAVGIGTTNPQSLLEVNGQGAFISVQQPNPGINGIQFGDASGTRGSIFVNGISGEMRHEAGSGGFGGFYSFYNAGQEHFHIAADGAVGIGYAPSAYNYFGSRCTLRQDQNAITRQVIRNENTGSSAGTEFTVNAAGNSWTFGMGSTANNANAFYIGKDVAAGTAAATYITIDVSGNVTATEQLRIPNTKQLTWGDSSGGYSSFNASVNDSDVFVLQANNAVLRLDAATGYVSINKPTPSYALDVIGNGNFTNWIMTNGVYVTGGGSTTCGMNESSGGGLSFRTGAVDGQVVIDTSGDVVLSKSLTTGFDASGVGLYLERGLRSKTGSSGTIIYMDAPTFRFRDQYNGFADTLSINEGGNVGIGTSGPTTRLHVRTAGGGADPGGLRIENSNSDTWLSHPVDGFNYIRGTTVLCDLGGNVKVGAGSVNPAYLLQVDGTTHVQNLRIPNTQSIAWAHSGDGYDWFTASVNANNLFTLSANNGSLHLDGITGHCGIGNAAPTDRLTVGNGTSDSRIHSQSGSTYAVRVSNGVGNGGYHFGATASVSTPDGVFCNHSGVETMRITDAGNLGVGTTNPTQRVEVAGTVKSTTSMGMLVAPVTTTDSAYIRFENAGGSTYFGMDNSSGTAVSGTPYAVAFNTPVAVVYVIGGVVRSTLNVNGEYINGDMVIAGGGGFGRTLAVGLGGAVQQNSIAIFGHSAINYAPLLSLYRAGSRECALSVVGGDLCFANTGGFANYQDSTLLAASSLRLRSTGEVTTTSSFDTQGATVGAGNCWQAKSQDVASGYWSLASTNTGHGMQMHSVGYLDTTFGYAIHSGSADPTVSDVASNSSLMWKNTTSGEVRHWVNDGGTMLKSAAYS